MLVAQGFTSTAFADFDVSFRHAIRGISGPNEDRSLLIFLAAYLRSSLAKYFLFHTSSNWGVSRQKLHLEELLRLPFPLPEALPDRRRSQKIVSEVNQLVTSAAAKASEDFADREELLRATNDSIEPLINEYFDVLPLERALVDDTVRVVIRSVRPSRKRLTVPTIEPSTDKQRNAYTTQLCNILNGWAKNGPFAVQGRTTASAKLGIGVAILQKTLVGEAVYQPAEDLGDLLAALERLRKVTAHRLNTFELIRGAKVFDRNCLYLVKPIAQRFWMQTAALNDADEIAGTILMRPHKGVAWP